MIKRIVDLFNRYVLRKELYHCIISRKDTEALDYFWEEVYYNPKGMEFKKYFKPKKVTKGYVFSTRYNIPFVITQVMNNNSVKVKRYIKD